MAKQTTVKPIALKYREVGGTGEYTPLMGVLKGLTTNQDDPDPTEIEAQFFDSPFYIYYEGKPVVMSFELANYDLSELPPIFGGEYNAEKDVYDGPATATTTEHEWRLEFGHGIDSLIICRGLTVGVIKMDDGGALNFKVTITSLLHTEDGKDHLYKLDGGNPKED